MYTLCPLGKTAAQNKNKLNKTGNPFKNKYIYMYIPFDLYLFVIIHTHTIINVVVIIATINYAKL